MNNSTEVGAAFEEIEMGLIESMQRNLKRHIKDEATQGVNWTQWQAEALRGLDTYTMENKARLPKYYRRINGDIETMIKGEYTAGALKQEKEILQGILNGTNSVNPSPEILKRLKKFKGSTLKEQLENMDSTDISQAFFKINDRKLNALLDESLGSVKAAEASILRHTQDVYRDTILKANILANSGMGTVHQAVDMATKDFLAKGIASIIYKDGRTVNIASYAEMAIRTANKRAFLQGEGEKREEWGISTVLVSQYGACSPLCLPLQNKVYIDDVWSNGKPDGKHPLISIAISTGLYHPNCRHTHSTFFEDINTIPPNVNSVTTTENSKLEQQQRYNERQIRKYSRLEKGSLDPKNINKYKEKRQEWTARNKQLIRDNPTRLRRDEWRERTIVPLNIFATPPPMPKKPDIRIGAQVRSMLGDRHSDNLEVKLKQCKNKLAVKVWGKYADDVKVTQAYGMGLLDTEHYSPKDKGLHIDIDYDEQGNSFTLPYGTTFHEFAHNIDDLGGSPSGSYISIKHKKTFNKMLEEETLNYYNAAGNEAWEDFKKQTKRVGQMPDTDIIKKANKNLKKLTKKKGSGLYSAASLSDIMGGFTKNKLGIGFGHEEKYWQSWGHPPSIEAFAEFYSDTIVDNVTELENIKNIYPKSYEIFEEILEELAK